MRRHFDATQPTVTERSHCRFVVRKNESDKPQIVLELFQLISQLKIQSLVMNSWAESPLNRPKKSLNDHVLNIFVETSPPVRKS